MLDFARAVSDAERLRVIGALVFGPRRPADITAELGLHPADLARHLEQLAAAGIVLVVDGSYRLDQHALETFARRQFSGKKAVFEPDQPSEPGVDRVLTAYLNPDGTIRQIPLQPAKLQVLLNYLVAAFSSGVDYTEKEVNTIIARFHKDVSGLRRDLVDAGLLARVRDGSRYWRPVPEDRSSE